MKLSLLVLLWTAVALPVASTDNPPMEAPTGFDDLTNGFTNQAQFDADRAVFDGLKLKADGLGPVYNGQSCGECHQNPTSGGISQVTALRAGSYADGIFVEHPGGSLIQDRAINANFQERVLGGNPVRAFRTSLNTLGDGFVECIENSTLVAIRDNQPMGMKGMPVPAPVLEAGGALSLGRFGWKDQHASLVSFAADSFLNEMGITNPLLPTDNTSNGETVVNGVPVDDGIADPEDDGEDVKAFTRFMRSTMAPPRDEVLAATIDAQAGSEIFTQVGCAICHVRDITTAPPGTVINGGAFVVPAALGNKVIHPFSDFLLHWVDTGDYIVQNGDPETRHKMRTAPLWGLRARDRLLHDGESLTIDEAVRRHGGEAMLVVDNYISLSNTKKKQILTFLSSL